MSEEFFGLSIYCEDGKWKSRVQIKADDGRIWETKDDGETFDHATALALVQVQRWIEHKKGLPPAGVKFGETK